MEAKNVMSLSKSETRKEGVQLSKEDRLAVGHMKYAQGVGASLRYANELRTVQQAGGRLPFLRSSKLHEDVLRGNLGPGNGFKDIFGDQEESAPSRLSIL